MAGNLGGLVVTLGLDGVQFFAGLTKAEYEARKALGSIASAATTVQNTIRTLGATLGVGIGIGAFVHLIKSTIDAADHLENLSKSTGVAVETLGGLGFAASQTGGNLDSMADSFRKFNINISAAAGGSEKELETFRALGISLKDLRTLTPDQLFIKAADAFASFEEGADKATRGSEAFGKAYQGILPTLDQGGKKLQQNIEYFKRYGLTSAEVTKAASDFNTEIAKAQLLGGAFGKNLTAELLGPMRVLVEEFVEAKEKGDQFASTAKSISNLIVNLAIGVLYVKNAFDELGDSIGATAARFQKWAQLDFKGASLIAEDEAQRLAETEKRFDSLIAKIRAAQNDPKAASLKDPPIPKRPPTRAPDTGLADAAKKILDRDLAALDNFIKSEEETLKQRERFLQDYYQHDEISITDYFGARQAAITEAIEKQGAAFAKEEALLRGRIAIAKPTERAEDEKKLADVIARRQKAEQDAAVASVTGFIEARRAAQAFQRSIEEVVVSVTELRGDSVVAAAFGFDLQNQQLRKRIDLEKESNDEQIRGVAIIGDRYLTELRHRTIEQARLNVEARKYALVTGQLAVDQGRIDLLLSTGAITEIDSLNKRSDLAAKYVVTLSKLADEQERLARAMSEGPAKEAALLGVQRLRLEIDQLAASSDVLAKRFTDIFESGFSTFLTDLIDHTKSVKQAFTDMAKSIEQQISKIAAQNISESLFGKEGALGGVGGFFAKLFGAKGADTGAQTGVAALGSTATTAAGSAAALAVSMNAAASAATMFSISASAGGLGGSFFGSGAGGLDAILGPGGLFGFAGGGSPPVHKWSIVGENGPELFMPKTAGNVIPMDEFRNKRMGDVSVTNIINVPQGTSRASADQIGLAAARYTQRAAGKLG